MNRTSKMFAAFVSSALLFACAAGSDGETDSNEPVAPEHAAATTESAPLVCQPSHVCTCSARPGESACCDTANHCFSWCVNGSSTGCH